MILIAQSGLLQSFHDASTHMWPLPVPLLEKILRPIIVYLALIALLRVFGKRELAQLNPFDLVVLLSLSNTVQNAIIGDDNSVSGGIIGALSLLAVNWIVARILYRSHKLTRLVEGRSTVLISEGKLNIKAMEHESLTAEELTSVIHKQGFTHLDQVHRCELEPNGTFYVEAEDPSPDARRHQELMSRHDQLQASLDALQREMAMLRGGTTAG